MSLPLAALSLALAAGSPQAAPQPTDVATAPVLTAAQQAIVAGARAAGATDVTTRPAPAGGFTLGGRLNGDQFAVSFPANWSGDGLVFAHGYSTPGTPVAVSVDPVIDGPGGGVMRLAYDEGLAAGHSAYAKDGLGVQTGTLNTKRLRDFLTRLGTKRVFAAGDSMGGGIVVTLLETYPGAFAGGLARCGVVGSWRTLIGQLYDMRATYNLLTKGTPYALPGVQDIRRSALSTTPPPGSPVTGQAYSWAQLSRIAAPILALVEAARKNPGGSEAAIVRQVAAIGGFPEDPGAIAFPLVTAALGADDMAATAGGQPYDNMKKLYDHPALSAAERARLNAEIQRVAGSPVARAYLVKWHETTGRLSAPLVTIHNEIDSLVPDSQETMLATAVKRAGRDKLLARYTVPAQRAPLPVGGIEGYTHCGFTPDQTKAAWTALRGWADTKRRPASDIVR